MFENLIDATQFQCRHIFTEGRRCSSPALRGEQLCYFHHGTRGLAAIPHRKTSRSRKAAFELPALEDRASIQISLGAILQRIASNQLDPRRAGLLLYGLQIASLNLPRETKGQPASEPVSEVVHDPILGPLAPPAEYYAPESADDCIARMIAKLDHQHEPATAPHIPEPPPADPSDPATPSTLPTLEAASAPQKSQPNPHLLRILRNNRRGGSSPNKRYVLQSASKSASCATAQRKCRDEHRSATRISSLDPGPSPANHPQQHTAQQHLRHRRGKCHR